MKVSQVDERDARVEMVADGYRVMLVSAGRRVRAFNLDTPHVEEALAWAFENRADGGFSVAARFNQSGGGVTLMWLTPPPEKVMEQLDS